MNRQVTVLVVGAGPVGLTAALVLARHGIDVRIIDAETDVDRRMRASTFHPPTLDMIDALGLADPLIAQGIKVSRWQMRQHETGNSVTFDLNLIGDATSHPYRLQVEQHRYCDIVISALNEPGVTVEFGNRLEALTQSDDAVRVALATGDPVSAKWVIGADGASSTVRKSLGLAYGGMTYTHSSVLVSTDVPFHDLLPDLADVAYCWSERGPFSLLRLRHLWRASLYPGVEDLDVAAEEARVRDWLAYIHPGTRDAQLIDVHPYRVHERCVDEFRVGRVLLAGDAAHLNPPSGGMGMNGGIHDAMNLTDKLISVIGGAGSALLDRYDRQRRHVITQAVIPQASANRRRMATTDRTTQLARQDDLREIAEDREQCRDFLLRSSMIAGLQDAETID